MREWAENCSLSVNEIEFEGDLFRGRCENLQEECQYRFRVVAVNKAGRSPTGPSSESVVAMHKNISPFIKVCVLSNFISVYFHNCVIFRVTTCVI